MHLKNGCATPIYLAGGTALALSMGHCKSIDFEFFTKDKSFNNVALLKNLSLAENFVVDINKEDTVYVRLFKAKVSFISYPFFVPKKDFIAYGGVGILEPSDVSAMKIIAISQRGKKRDFFDLYWYLNNIESLENVIKRLKHQYPSVAHDYHHILKSLTYFEDAENDPYPIIYFDADWNKVKEFFKKEIPLLTKKSINLNED
ncbi:MAG: nucleotidyl transferase AbiEii/AbiGii toxin family protein [Candidatus Pacebacteria bacterium]|nr:nucleotidyl transferase AbiEii/AbiGii toxin family protein [Candidatus Paceibacterota bacterium]